MRHPYDRLGELLAAGETVALLKVVQVDGSAPQVVGAALLLRADGSFEGTIGGGAVESRAIADARTLLREGRSGLLRYNLAADLGMCCGGIMQVFCEVLEPTRRLVMFGGGHVAQPTAAVASQAGFEVWVVDERPEWASRERFPTAARLVHLAEEDAFAEVAVTPRDFVLVVTRGHEHDQQVLEHYVRATMPCYLGVIGSRSKTARAIARCRARGISDEVLAGVRMPVGLDIGAVTPAEIAVAIVAELIAVRRGQAQRVFPGSMAAGNPLHSPRAEHSVAAQAATAPAVSGERAPIGDERC